MKQLALFLLVGFVAAATLPADDEKVDYTGYAVVRVEIQSVQDENYLKGLEEEFTQLKFWNEISVKRGYTLIQVPPTLKHLILFLLEDNNLKSEVTIPDMQKLIDEEAVSAKAAGEDLSYAARASVASFNYAKYYTLEDIYKYLDTVAGEFSQLAETVIIGKTTENRDIKGIRISTAAKGTRPAIFIECGIHAREWVSPATGIYIIGQLTSGYSNDTAVRQLLSKYEVYIFPSTNPDGYVYTHKTNRNWRKTRSRSKKLPLCVGADANRNLDSSFCGVGSSSNPCSDTYCGDGPFSEPETQALRNITTSIGSRLKIYFSIHSYSQLWMYPYGYTKSLPPNYADLERVSQIGTSALKAVHGKSYRYGPIATTIYQASGSTVDWVYDTLKTKYAFALELRDTGTFGFLLPAGQILPTARETWAGIKAAIQAIY